MTTGSERRDRREKKYSGEVKGVVEGTHIEGSLCGIRELRPYPSTQVCKV